MDLDFTKIRIIDGDRRNGFEEFVCQIARYSENLPVGSFFQRYRGAGGDGGVECTWTLPNGDEWGWQSKYLFDIDPRQFRKSVETALKVRPNLKRYIFALPFDLTTKTNRRGKSQTQKYEDYKKGWEELAYKMGRKIVFELLTRSDLIDKLTRIDSSGGKFLFWFDEQFFTKTWFKNQIDDSIIAAGPRYTPKLNVKTPISEVFDAFGKTSDWQTKVFEKLDSLDMLIDSWNRCLNYGDWDGKKDFPESARKFGNNLMKSLQRINDQMKIFFPNGLKQKEIEKLRTEINRATRLATKCEDFAKEAIESVHGKGKADSIGFKQFMSEYQVSFPTRHYDAAKEIGEELAKLDTWFEDSITLLPNSSVMLMVGAAGVGKTHTICDVSRNRFAQGLKSILLLGHQFTDLDLWTQIKNLLGIQPNKSRDQLLEALNTSAEASGFPLIILIDGINETEPKSLWFNHLPTFLEQTARFKWIKVCISCRSTFLKEVVPDYLNLPTVEHHGFKDVEFDACFEFFNFYGIESPSMPLLQPEYSNPLFLKLLCESLSDLGRTRLPEGIIPFNILLKLLFNAKNKKLSRSLNYDEKDNRVEQAINEIAQEIHKLQTPWLKWDVAKNLIESLWPSIGWSNSFFNNLLKENLLKEDRAIDPDSGQVINTVSISYERLGDHIIIAKYLSDKPDIESLMKAFKNKGEMSFMVVDSFAFYQHKGLIEALSIQVPHKYKIELDRLITISPDEIKQIKINSLQWRDSSSITPEAIKFFEEKIKNGTTRDFIQVADALLSIATVTDHPLNAHWLHEIFSKIPMYVRDGKLSPFLHLTYSTNKNVDRLIRWGLKSDIRNLTRETAILWITILCWFTSASDRRVRDYTTKAMIRIGEIWPDIWLEIITKFMTIDDEYIIERCLATSYGTLLRTRDEKVISATAELIFSNFFKKGLLFKNALIIDYARLIIDLAVHFGSTDFDPNKYLPPYIGNKDIEWPTEDFVDKYKDTYWEIPKLHMSCLNDDFKHYTVPSVIRKYEGEKITDLEACRWIFKHVLDMGYGPGTEVAEFDKYLLSKYGGGRSRPEWAERVGKKYQWIALYRLAAKLAIKYPCKKSDIRPSASEKGLLVEDERNIDPSILIHSSNSSYKSSWWSPIRYMFTNPDLLPDIEWLHQVDFPDSPNIFIINDWIVLDVNYNWEHKSPKSKNCYPMRNMWMHVDSFLVKKEDAEKCWKWIQKQNFMGNWMPRGYELHYGFFGEYPWGVLFNYLYEDQDCSQSWYEDRKLPCSLIPTMNYLNINFSFDAYQKDSINVNLPSQLFFQDSLLEWNSVSGYLEQSGVKIFYDPAMEEEGPHALLVKKEFLLDFLERNGLSIFWTVLSEKLIIPGTFSHGPGHTDYSRVYRLKNGKLIASKPVIEKVKHEKEDR